MPRLSRGGLVCAPGTGSGVVSVEGVPVASDGGDANWYTDTEIAYVHHASAQIVAYNVELKTYRTLYSSGANWLRARDGGWARWLNGEIRTSEGWVGPPGYLAEVADDQVWIADPSLTTLTAYLLNGTPAGISLVTGALGQDATAGLNVRVRDGFLLYQSVSGWHLIDLATREELPIAARVEPINYAVPLSVGGSVPWLLERSGRLTLRPYNDTHGFFVTDELCFGADAVATLSRVEVVWSITQGEQPENIRRAVSLGRVIDLNEKPEEPTMKVKVLNLRSRAKAKYEAAYVAAEVYDSGRKALHANRVNPGGWEKHRVYLLEDKWDVGKTVVLEAYDTPGWYWSLDSQGGLILDHIATVFVVDRGEDSGTWGLRVGSSSLSARVDMSPQVPLLLQKTPTGHPQSWESFEVYDAETGKRLTDPF